MHIYLTVNVRYVNIQGPCTYQFDDGAKGNDALMTIQSVSVFGSVEAIEEPHIKYKTENSYVWLK